MASLRFPTVRDLYDAFPTAADDVGAPPNDTDSLAFLRSLAEQESWNAAVSFCAYLLPRRDAVWWGCQSLRRIQSQFTPAEIAALDAAESWVQQPEEELRRAALDVGLATDNRLPAAWMALAAGWSGGSITPADYGMVPAEPYQTARALRAGLLMAMARLISDDAPAIMKPCIESGIALADDDRR